MKKPVNKRQRFITLDRVMTVVFAVILLVCLAGLAKQCRDIEALQEQINSTSITIVAADTYLPDGFHAENAAYQAALQRYEIEQGHVLPDKKETAPEAATPEAVDARKNIS